MNQGYQDPLSQIIVHALGWLPLRPKNPPHCVNKIGDLAGGHPDGQAYWTPVLARVLNDYLHSQHTTRSPQQFRTNTVERFRR